MRVYVWREYYAICDKCENSSLGTNVTFAETRRDAGKNARQAGWRTIRGKFLCPGCQAGYVECTQHAKEHRV